MDEAASQCKGEQGKRIARFDALQGLLSSIDENQVGEASSFVMHFYQTGLQAALLEGMVRSASQKSENPSLILREIQKWPLGSGRWMCVRELATSVPRASLDSLMRDLATSSLQEEKSAAAAGLDHRISHFSGEGGLKMGEFNSMLVESANWPEEVRKLLNNLEPQLSKASLAEGYAKFAHDPVLLNTFLGCYRLREPGGLAKWLLHDAPIEYRTVDNLMLGVLDGMDDPVSTCTTIEKMQVPTEECRATATSTLVGVWMQHDPDAASQWVRTLKTPGEQKGGGTAIVEYLKRTEDRAAQESWETWLKQTVKE